MNTEGIALATAIGLVGLCLLATWHDLKARRIPNAVALAGTVLGLGLRVPAGGEAVLEGLLGVGLGLGVGVLLFAIGAFGGGDGKFLMAVGAFLGPVHLGWAMLVMAVVGGGLALLYAAKEHVLLPALWNTGRMLKYLLTFGRAGELRPLAMAPAGRVPYAAAIASGAIIWWFWGRQLV